ncbi:MAG: PIG-L family deacetylase, partial [Rhodoglobus sp.]|nr:PIG-L family deacetylase [Rhodoglobus sp.]
ESITTGGTIATLVDRGAEVAVLTCTRGELGEVIPETKRAELSSPAALGERREAELAAALAALGVTDHVFLGAEGARFEGRIPRRYLDSGMRWGEHGAEALPESSAGSLTAAEFGEVASDIATVIAAYAPDAVVTYDADGGYGHPDHVRVHEATRRAAEVLSVPFFAIQAPDAAGPDLLAVDVSPVLERKRAALAAHVTQVTLDGDSFALADGVSRPIGVQERFRRIRPVEPSDDYSFAQQGIVAKIANSLIALVIGAFAGSILTVVHQATATIAGVAVPWGIIAAVVLTIALLAGLRLVFGTRVIAGVAAAGLLATVALLSLTSAGGSILVPANVAGYTWTFAPVLIAILVLGWPRVRRAAPGRIAE